MSIVRSEPDPPKSPPIVIPDPPPLPPPPPPAASGAYAQMAALLASYGLSSLLGFLQNLLSSGITDAASLQLALQETPQWKARFAGNEMLRGQGLGVLSPAEYLSMERAYAQVMKNYGLPKGFYDDPGDYAKWIGGNISVNELTQRVAAYSDLAMREDPGTKAQMVSMGMGHGELHAYMMDPTRALPILQQQYKTVLLGSSARRAGYTANNDYLAQLAQRGVTEDQASQGYGLIAGSLVDANTLGHAYSEDYAATDMQSEIFDRNAGSAAKRRRLASAERASFGGSAGAGGQSRNTAGSY